MENRCGGMQTYKRVFICSLSRRREKFFTGFSTFLSEQEFLLSENFYVNLCERRIFLLLSLQASKISVNLRSFLRLKVNGSVAEGAHRSRRAREYVVRHRLSETPARPYAVIRPFRGSVSLIIARAFFSLSLTQCALAHQIHGKALLTLQWIASTSLSLSEIIRFRNYCYKIYSPRIICFILLFFGGGRVI